MFVCVRINVNCYTLAIAVLNVVLSVFVCDLPSAVGGLKTSCAVL